MIFLLFFLLSLQQNTAFLPYLDDRQLMNLFVATTTGNLSPRAKAILSELLERGYFFDVSRHEFLTEKQWKALYQQALPLDYFAYWQSAHNKRQEHGRGARNIRHSAPIRRRGTGL